MRNGQKNKEVKRPQIISHRSPQIVTKVAKIVRKKLWNEPTSHDWWHVERVWQSAQKIAIKRHKYTVNFIKQFLNEWYGTV